jgi:hypothetical protein
VLGVHVDVNAIDAGAPNEMEKVDESTRTDPNARNRSVLPVPAVSTLRPLNVISPPLAVAIVVPLSVPEPLPSVTVATVAPSDVAEFPDASLVCTRGCCAKGTPDALLVDGCVFIIRTAGVPCDTVTEEEVVEPPAAVKRSVFVPTRLSRRLENTATPLATVSVTVPLTAPLPDATVTVTTDALSVVRTFPAASLSCTCGEGDRATSETAAPGRFTVTTSCAVAPGETVIVALLTAKPPKLKRNT